jgi:glycosyltransferase 2 family protein
MQSSTVKKVAKSILRVCLPILVLLAVVYFLSGNLKKDWEQLASARFQLHIWLLALAFLGFLLQELSYGIIWRGVLGRLGYHLDLRASLRIYLASEFVRYIPGNVWHVLTRILWVGKYGVPRPVAFASMVVELITKLASAALIFAASLLFWGNIAALNGLLKGYSVILVAVGIASILGLLVILHPRVLNGLLNVALRTLKRDSVVLTLRYVDILQVTLAWCVSWLIAGSAFYLLILALGVNAPLATLPVCIGIYAIIWDIGFLSFITPGGLGFRESAAVVLLVPALSLALAPATVIAILSRLVSTAAELLCVSLAYISGGRQVRSIQQEQSAAQPSIPENHISDNQEAHIPLSDMSASIPVERGAASD